MEKQQLNIIIELLGKFKDLKRTGWLKRGVILPESDAEHSFSLAMLVLLLTPEKIDRSKCMEMALIHDLAELYVGDYTPEDGISQEEKHRKELVAMKRISQELSTPYLMELFSEFEEQQTKEAKFVKALDKVDTVLTACYYDKNNRSSTKLVPEFGGYAQKCVQEADFEEIPFVKDVLNQLVGANN